MLHHEYSTDGPVCPYCDHRHDPADDPEIFYEEGERTWECEYCGKKFVVETYRDWSWSTRKSEAECAG